LTINVGSSSVKAGLYRWHGDGSAEVRVIAERIGTANSRLRMTDARGVPLYESTERLPDHAAAVGTLLAWLRDEGLDREIVGVGQRVVHGGKQYTAPTLVSDEVLAALRALVPLDPEHLPQTLEVIERVRQIHPHVPQVACFDTAFHRHMPEVAQLYALPAELGEAGVARYGFHGLSYEYLVRELRALEGPAADGRVVIAHLGNGASMAALRDGISVDTTMGFTPTGGLVMSTRSGDLDPGVLIHLLESRGMDPGALSRLVNQRSGLLAVSGTTGDMEDLLAAEAADPRAATAVALFCYQARKFLGGLVAVLGGLDALVFTAGIGEHAPQVRERICAGFAYLGLELDPERNGAGASIISSDASLVMVRVIATDEDVMIARHTRRLLAERGSSDV
jgi:acetate kinase